MRKAWRALQQLNDRVPRPGRERTRGDELDLRLSRGVLCHVFEVFPSKQVDKTVVATYDCFCGPVLCDHDGVEDGVVVRPRQTGSMHFECLGRSIGPNDLHRLRAIVVPASVGFPANSQG